MCIDPTTTMGFRCACGTVGCALLGPTLLLVAGGPKALLHCQKRLGARRRRFASRSLFVGRRVWKQRPHGELVLLTAVLLPGIILDISRSLRTCTRGVNPTHPTSMDKVPNGTLLCQPTAHTASPQPCRCSAELTEPLTVTRHWAHTVITKTS